MSWFNLGFGLLFPACILTSSEIIGPTIVNGDPVFLAMCGFHDWHLFVTW
jgi:hypothetical protein